MPDAEAPSTRFVPQAVEIIRRRGDDGQIHARTTVSGEIVATMATCIEKHIRVEIELIPEERTILDTLIGSIHRRYASELSAALANPKDTGS